MGPAFLLGDQCGHSQRCSVHSAEPSDRSWHIVSAQQMHIIIMTVVIRIIKKTKTSVQLANATNWHITHLFWDFTSVRETHLTPQERVLLFGVGQIAIS